MIGRRHWWRFGGVGYDVEVLFWKRVPKRNARISRFMSIKFYTINLENPKTLPHYSILTRVKKKWRLRFVTIRDNRSRNPY